MRVWVDQDLCTGDGLCTDHCPEVFMLLDDGLSYVRDASGTPCHDPGGRASMVTVPTRCVDQAIAAAIDCPGECIFLEDDEPDDVDDADVFDAALVRGAAVSGLDAAEALIEIARARTPDGDFRVGDMCALPFDGGSFDVVTSFNGIWNGCDAALDQARRVLADDGLRGLTYWGSYERMGLMPYFLTVIEHSPPSHQAANMEIGETSNVIADMLRTTNFELLDQGTVEVINEWPDVDTAVRALAAAGPSVPAIEAVGYEEFCGALRDVIGPLCDQDGHLGVRISSELGWVTARPN